jgi:glutamine synthetase
MQTQAQDPTLKTRSSEEIVRALQASASSKVKVAICDMDGVLRGKYIDKQKCLSALSQGFGFCSVVFGWDVGDVCYDSSQFKGFASGYPDAQAHLDLQTFRQVPWDGQIPFFLADFRDKDARPLPICPRQVLKAQLEKARLKGFDVKLGMEFEWFNFNETPQTLRSKNFCDLEPLTPGMFGYSILRAGCNLPYINALFDELRAFDIPLEALHTESGPGVFEAALQNTHALEAADRAVLFKTAVKEIANRHHITASFMAKWRSDLPGCGGHLHQSLSHRRDNSSAFYAAGDPQCMSPTFRHYVAGQLHCLADILPMFAPNVNSYKRLVEGKWAPTRATWGTDNRTTALRVIGASPQATRLETRVGGADINPYLAVAAAVAAGLYGIEQALPLHDDPVHASGYRLKDADKLPRTLKDATDKMASSKLSRLLFGDAFVDHYCASRRWEWQQFQSAVTNWEVERYIEII